MVAGVGLGACFVAGTKVLTDTGNRNIEEIRVGDNVLSKNLQTGTVEYKQVTQTFVRNTKELVVLNINGSIISTTHEHPFFVKGRGWTKAGWLSANDLIQQADGGYAAIKSTKVNVQNATVYNFEVADNHNYYVDKGYLVHNTCTAIVQTVTQLSNALPTIMTTITNVAPAVLALLGIAAVGTAIDAGILNLPNGVNLNKNTVKKLITVSEIIAGTAATTYLSQERVYCIAYAPFVKGADLVKSPQKLNYIEALTVLGSVFTAIVITDYFVDAVVAIITPEMQVVIDFLNNTGITKEKLEGRIGIYTELERDASYLAYGVGLMTTNIMEAEKHANAYYHYHDKYHAIHIWFGQMGAI